MVKKDFWQIFDKKQYAHRKGQPRNIVRDDVELKNIWDELDKNW